MDPEMDSQLKIGFIGAGNMAFGIAKGILSGESGESCWKREQDVLSKGAKSVFCVPFKGNVLPVNVKVSAPSSRNLGRFQVLFSFVFSVTQYSVGWAGSWLLFVRSGSLWMDSCPANQSIVMLTLLLQSSAGVIFFFFNDIVILWWKWASLLQKLAVHVL